MDLESERCLSDPLLDYILKEDGGATGDIGCQRTDGIKTGGLMAKLMFATEEFADENCMGDLSDKEVLMAHVMAINLIMKMKYRQGRYRQPKRIR